MARCVIYIKLRTVIQAIIKISQEKLQFCQPSDQLHHSEVDDDHLSLKSAWRRHPRVGDLKVFWPGSNIGIQVPSRRFSFKFHVGSLEVRLS